MRKAETTQKGKRYLKKITSNGWYRNKIWQKKKKEKIRNV